MYSRLPSFEHLIVPNQLNKLYQQSYTLTDFSLSELVIRLECQTVISNEFLELRIVLIGKLPQRLGVNITLVGAILGEFVIIPRVIQTGIDALM